MTVLDCIRLFQISQSQDPLRILKLPMNFSTRNPFLVNFTCSSKRFYCYQPHFKTVFVKAIMSRLVDVIELYNGETTFNFICKLLFRF